jgi:ABC-2 type transport system permease protein
MSEQVNVAEEFRVAEYRLEGRANTWGDWRSLVTLVRYLTLRHLATRYRGSALGFIWSFLNPIMMMGVYTFVFSFLFRSTVPGVPYPLFFLTGILAWNFFSIGTMNAASSVIEGSYLYNKAYFPRIVLPISAILSNGVNYLAALVLLLIFNFLGGVKLSVTFLYAPLAMALLLVVTLSIGLLMAVLAPSFRDILQLLEVVLSFWFFMTPVIYPMSLPLGKLEGMHHNIPLLLYQANPMVGTVRFVQSVFLGQPVPLGQVLYTAVFSGALLALAVFLFLREQAKFSERV